MARNEKIKSAGFLDNFFGRKHKIYNAGGLEEQHELDISLGVAKLSNEEINIKFMEILEDMNIPKDKREPLMLKDIKEKREMLIMHYKGKVSSWTSSRFEKPHEYKVYLREGDHSPNKILQCIESLRVALTSNPISWIKEFGEDGLDEIVGLLQKCKQKRDYEKIEFECIRCLKAILNNSWGINVVLKPEQHAAVLLLAQSLDIQKPQSMCEALKLLAGFCLLNERNGYNKVLTAVSCASVERFKPLVDGLFVEHDLEERGQKTEKKGDLCYHSLLFINTIINTPSDLNFRLHLRCEIMRTGLYERLDTLVDIVNSSNNESLEKHFKIFTSFRDEDFEEFSSRFDNIRLEIDDINDCFEILRNTVVDTNAEPYFLSILQHLLYIKDDHLYKPAYYKLIEECISQIVLHKSGCDPNFKNRNFNIDTAVLLDDLAEKNKVLETQRVDELEKRIEELQAVKQEAEAKVAHLEEKLKLISNSESLQSTANIEPLFLSSTSLIKSGISNFSLQLCTF
uniref:CSON008218 protein n=1 Tax=Culicoides sonorensis TaxID=179676 RepID=A0A336K1Z8_CULSO